MKASAIENFITVNALNLGAITISMPFSVSDLPAAWICPNCGAEYGLYISGDYFEPLYMTNDGDSCIAALNHALHAECSGGHPTEHMKSVDGAPAEVVQH